MALPNSKSQQLPGEREKIKRVIARRGLCGLANDTKWDEFIDAMRAHIRPFGPDRTWSPSYRTKCVDGLPSGWDYDWMYHLPLPMLSTEWLDICHIQEISNNRIPPKIERVDHSAWIEEILNRVGLEYKKGNQTIRVFGYSPKDLTLFDSVIDLRRPGKR